jgi:N-acetylmuramoyl-L-alanine amidase
MLSTPSAPHRAAAILLLWTAFAGASASSHGHAESALNAFNHAERLREALEGRPQTERTRAQYARVLDAYRAIYRNGPANPEAAAAVDAAAGLLAEEGRLFNEPALLNEAVAQYSLLRRDYPASHFRQSALLSQAEIEESDLHDDASAKKDFGEFLAQYPHSPLAGEARQQLKGLHRRENITTTTAYREPLPAQAPNDESTKAQQARENAAQHARELAELNAAGSTARPTTRHQAAPVQAALDTPPSNAGGPVLITGIRHWSTPIYTRVAIDLSSEVKYEAARVPNPDRIYFDLHGAKLAPEMVGKSFDVADDGFLKRVRAAQYSSDSTRIVLDVSHVSEYSAFFLPNPSRLIIDIHGAVANGALLYGDNEASNSTPASPHTPIKTGTSAQSLQEVASLGQAPTRVKATHHPTTGPISASVSGTTRAAQPNELEALTTTEKQPTPAPPPLVKRTRRPPPATDNPQLATVTVPQIAPAATPSPSSIHEATPTSSGERSLVRALGLKIGRIVIDAGHGGHDSGTLGAEGIEEKDIVLDVSLRLGKLLKQRLGADVIYTRDDDTFVPLETRTAIANKAQADLFISVHGNSSSDPSARGVEVYYLNFTTSPEALEVAARENAVSDQSIYQLSDLVKKITLKDKIDESHEFATDVENSLYTGLEEGNSGLKDRGVKKAPFVVLIGANMPSILAEISFLTNPEDAREMREPAYRERIAESLYAGVARYVSGLSGVRLAQNGHPAGQ